MNYLSSLAKTWSSINPATLSGAIDVIVIEDEKGNLNCSPFHIRFGKFQLLRPSQKKVNFKVNGHLTNIQMKLGDGGEAFFVFQTADSVDRIPNDMMTSPVVSAVSSAASSPLGSPLASPKSEPESLEEPPYLDIGPSEEPEHIASTTTNSNNTTSSSKLNSPIPQPYYRSSFGNPNDQNGVTKSSDAILDGAATASSPSFTSSSYPSDNILPPSPSSSPPSAAGHPADHHLVSEMKKSRTMSSIRSLSPGRAQKLSKTLTLKNIPTKIDSNGELVLDMSGYKASEEDVQNYDNVIKDLLKDEFGQDFDLSDIISYDQEGKVRIYSSANEEDDPNATQLLNAPLITSSSDLSDVEGATTAPVELPSGNTTPSNTAGSDYSGTGTGTGTGADTGTGSGTTGSDSGSAGTDTTTSSSTSSLSRINFIKTLRLTSEQLKCLNLRYGANDMEFTVDKSKSTITSKIFLWKYNVPVVISDIDGTITKSDALGHVFTMIGKDWTHLGVSKLFSDIKLNGYNIMYLTARSVGLADTTRAYLNGIEQDGVKIPQGPVILSPDRTMAALRREVILKKPEVFKITCLKDLRTLYGNINKTPFYAGFGNRITDALSYRSVDIPSSRIFTINTDGDVHMELLELAGYKSSYIHINELVDHFFPPVNVDSLSSDEKKDGVNVFTDENFTDTVYWRDPIPEFSDSEDDDDSVNQNPSPSQNGSGNAAGGGSSTTTNTTGNINDSSSRSASAQPQQNMPKKPEVSATDLEALAGNKIIEDKRDSIGSLNNNYHSNGLGNSNSHDRRKLSLSPNKNDTIKDAVEKGKLLPNRHNDSTSNNNNNKNNNYNSSNSQNNDKSINAKTTGNHNNANNTLNILNAEYNDDGEENDLDYSPSELSFEDDYLNNDDLIDDEFDEYNNSVDDLEGHFDDEEEDDEEDEDEDEEHSDESDEGSEHSGDEANNDIDSTKNTKKVLPKT